MQHLTVLIKGIGTVTPVLLMFSATLRENNKLFR